MAGNNSDDPVLLLIAIFAIIGGLLWLVWYAFNPQLLEALRYLRLAELLPLIPFDKQAAACFDWLRIAPIGVSSPSGSVLMASAACFGEQNLLKLPYNETIKFYNLSASSVGAMGRLTGGYYKWLVLAVAGYYAYYMAFVTERNKFKTRYNLESFIKIQAKMWPVIQPFVAFNPAKHSARILGSPMPDKLPTFAESMAPEEWLSFNQIPITGGIPDKERVRRTLMAQLGPRWTGFKDLPPYIAVLVAAFALKGVQKRDESDDFLGRIAVCWSQEKGFRPTSELMAETKKYLNDPEIGGVALTIANKYAFRTTAFLGLLKWARYMGGVLASAQFLWLRGVDRALWYAGNNLGRRSFHTEGAGAMAHYMAEETAQKPLPIPRLDTAIITINQYLAANQPKIPPYAGPNSVKA